MKRNHFLAVLMALVLAAGLAGCGKNGESRREAPAFQSARSYTGEDIPLPVEAGKLHGSCTDGTTIYFLVTPEGETEPVLCRAPLDGGEALRMEEFRGEGYDFRDLFLDGGGGLWAWAEGREDGSDVLLRLGAGSGRREEIRDISEAAVQTGNMDMIRCIAMDREGNVFIGTTQKLVVLDGRDRLRFTLEGGEMTPILLSDGSAAAGVSSGMKNEVRTVDLAAEDWGEARFRLPGGLTAVRDGRGAYRFFYLRDGQLFGWDASEELDLRLLDWADAQGADCRVRCFALLAEGRLAALLQEGDPMSDDGTGALHLRLLSPADRPPDEGKVRLTCGAINAGQELRSRIARFNETHPDCYIQLRDYGEGTLDQSQGAEDYNAAMEAARKRMLVELAAGQVPDILDGSLPLDVCERRGYLADLWPFIDSDPETGRETLMDHVLECMETDGKLCQIGSHFTIQTLAASADITGDRTGWTLEELLASCGGEPELYEMIPFTSLAFYLQSASGMLYSLTAMNMDQYVDWNAGTCAFDGEDFQAVLSLCARFQEDTWDASGGWASPEGVTPWQNRRVLLSRELGSVWDFTLDDALFGGPETLEDYEALLWEKGVLSMTEEGVENNMLAPDSVIQAESARAAGNWFGLPFDSGAAFGAPGDAGYAAYIGYPTESGTGSAFAVFGRAAISASCRDPEGAWDFIRTLLLPTGEPDKAELGARFPINRADFERSLEPAYIAGGEGTDFLDGNGERVEASLGCFAVGNPVAMLVHQLAPGQEQIDRFWALYGVIDRVSRADWTLMNLITEQAEAYFAGDRSLEETAELIQNRAQLYVGENMEHSRKVG